ncbi:hypothetical protein GAN75_12435 [Bacteroides thetaiotaomicron]|jgi:lipoprotein|uniref:Lipoprotein n=1 Tax=Bacteroides thetaiotaomicron TaxID=818 RepID=A0A7J5JXP1_BACT4|nr:hypothetical protein [Bacteroides thetaiotaomicron]KAB4456119.1 hypothetical protein GAN75_12435 [Bacteroides thetaiotaomicron]MBT9897885.1 hypothetical protein [Bacteroides thetaiotaomicron]MCA6026640.1 hypothetical protein [Bacteroides thetaiotaomicron]MCE9149346.1 hypothetical protein [Bacteroides thetaiotaomicron]
MRTKHVFKLLFASMSFLFLSCNNENIINNSLNSKDSNVTTRSDMIEWGSANCTVTTDGRMIVSWNYPTGSSQPCGMLFSLYSRKNGRIFTFETFDFEMSGNRSFKLPDNFKIEEEDVLWLQIEDSYTSLPSIIYLAAEDGCYKGRSIPKCNHYFNQTNVNILHVNTSNRSITGRTFFDRPCKVIMRYNYYDRISNTVYEKEINQEPNSTYIEISYSPVHYYVENINCILRIYDLTCNKHIPQSEEDLDETGNCTNFFEVKFSIPTNSTEFDISLCEVK